MEFIIKGKLKPYVRMTGRSKWANPQAAEYLRSQDRVRIQLRLQMAKNGYRMIERGEPLAVKIGLCWTSGHHRRDLDNEIKAVLDAAQGIVFEDDRWVDHIMAHRIQSISQDWARLEVMRYDATAA